MCRSSNSPESGLGTSRVSLPDSESGVGSGSGGAASATNDPHLAEDEADFYDADEPLTVLGMCRALYTFDGELRLSELTVLLSPLTVDRKTVVFPCPPMT